MNLTERLFNGLISILEAAWRALVKQLRFFALPTRYFKLWYAAYFAWNLVFGRSAGAWNRVIIPLMALVAAAVVTDMVDDAWSDKPARAKKLNVAFVVLGALFALQQTFPLATDEIADWFREEDAIVAKMIRSSIGERKIKDEIDDTTKRLQQVKEQKNRIVAERILKQLEEVNESIKREGETRQLKERWKQLEEEANTVLSQQPISQVQPQASPQTHAPAIASGSPPASPSPAIPSVTNDVQASTKRAERESSRSAEPETPASEKVRVSDEPRLVRSTSTNVIRDFSSPPPADWKRYADTAPSDARPEPKITVLDTLVSVDGGFASVSADEYTTSLSAHLRSKGYRTIIAPNRRLPLEEYLRARKSGYATDDATYVAQLTVELVRQNAKPSAGSIVGNLLNPNSQYVTVAISAVATINIVDASSGTVLAQSQDDYPAKQTLSQQAAYRALEPTSELSRKATRGAIAKALAKLTIENPPAK
ncbi:MAG: hypothetical protein ACR2IF_04505 [Terriglobales bacterium]